MTQPIRVTIWNEFRHEKSKPVVAELYPEGIHASIEGFSDWGLTITSKGVGLENLDAYDFINNSFYPLESVD